MRLIDADALMEKLNGIWDCNDMTFAPVDECCIDADCKSCRWRETIEYVKRLVKNQTTVSPWHRVGDKLPEIGKIVLVYDKWDRLSICQLDNQYRWLRQGVGQSMLPRAHPRRPRHRQKRKERDEMLNHDMIISLLACAGEATLGYALMQVGLLEKVTDDIGLPVPSIRSDPYHVAVITLGEFPQRLVYDYDFGWLWYNADGPEGDTHDDAPVESA